MSIFKNKSVALIGPADHIATFKQAKRISFFDLVVRTNTALPIPEDVEKCTGKRCDVLYCNIMNDATGQATDLYDIKEFRAAEEAIMDVDFEKVSRFYDKFKFNKIDKRWAEDLAKKIGTYPNTGFQAICEILAEQCSVLYITGFTFWQSGQYYKGYLNDERLEKKTTYLKGDVQVHAQAPQIEYFMKNIYTLPQVICDPILEHLCETEFKFIK